MEYEDNPLANLEYLKTLTAKELQLYIKGYLMACAHIRESFSKGKIEFLNSFMFAEENEILQAGLLNNIKLLDNYEDLVKTKETLLLKLFPKVSR